LREAGLLRDEMRGRERVYDLELSALTELEAFLRELRATVASEWERRFMALDTEIHRVRRQRERTTTTTTTTERIKKKETA
jgi:hypothetical protein